MKTSFSLTLLALLLFAPAIFAKERECCWIDAKTGKPVGSVPATALIRDEDGSAEVHSMDNFSKTAFNRRTKQNYAKDDDGCWIDVKTGKQVGTVPATALIRDEDGSAEVHSTDNFSKTAFNRRTKQNYVRVPCPQPGKATGETLKKVFDAVHIGIGIGGGYTSGHDERHHGEDRRRTADKVSTDKTKTHKISPTTTHKTVTSACKCHPCTCSPCTCH